MIFLAFFYKISEKAEFWMDLGVRGSQIISEKLPIFNYEGYRVGSSRARGHAVGKWPAVLPQAGLRRASARGRERKETRSDLLARISLQEVF